MVPQQDPSGYDVDAIDLTMSSPEPEARPQHRAIHTQPQPHVRSSKEEPGGLYRSSSSSNSYGQRHGSTRSDKVLQRRQRRINPDHVKQIIDSSDPRALRSVIMQLCKASPALSGALVRGLAPGSRWAQALVSREQVRPQTQAPRTIKTETHAKEDDAYARMKRRLGPSGSAQSVASQTSINRSTAVRENRDNLRLPPRSQKVPAVKRERWASSTDSDDSTNIVDFPSIKHDAQEKPSRHSITQSSPRHPTVVRRSAGLQTTHQLSAQNGMGDQKQKLCSQCGDFFKDGDVECYFHTGREGPARPGDIPQFTCCNRFVGELGCKVGRHTSERRAIFTNTKRPSPSPRKG